MIFLDFSLGHHGPRVWNDTEELTNRCWKVDILPDGWVSVHLYAEPKVVDTVYVDSGFGMGVPESELRKQIISGQYMVISCSSCDEGEAQ